MSLIKYSFSGLLAKEKIIRIPKIQRDYAQGRRNKKVDEIRKIFVHTLLLVVKGKRPETELDFVYGSNVDDAFEPLDGQQRLTTLFLLHWMLGVDLSTNESTKHSVFTYETRNTSREFCDELVQHEAISFVQEIRQNKTYNEAQQEAKKKDNTVKVNLKPIVPSQLIAGRDWFKWEWKYDPTISSMLVMIDAIYEEMGDDWEKMDLSDCRAKLENISFNELNLGEFGLSNELFIKMNARGKQLSDFDKMKSSLEEELQLQQKEINVQGAPLATEEDEERWRTLVDGTWIDLFWQKYASEVFVQTEQYIDKKLRKSERLKAAKYCELQFKKLLLRLIAIQILEDGRCSWKLRGHAYNMNEDSIDNLLFEYSDSLAVLRSDENHVVVPADQYVFNFKRLMDDVNLLIYEDDNGKNHEISDILFESSRINPGSGTIFDYFLGQEIAKDVIPVCYSMLLFLRAFPAPKDKLNDQELFAWHIDTNTYEPWRKNLEVWVKMSRNVLLNVNNNIRIDKIEFLCDAMKSLITMRDELVSFVELKNAENNEISILSDGTLVHQFLCSSTKNYTRLDNQSMIEERKKASRIIGNSSWEKEYSQAEQHPYLWGQIRCLDNWCNDNIEDFIDYRNKLIALLDFAESHNNTYYTALLAFDPSCWVAEGRLFLRNKERDNSIKRQLRDYNQETEVYGATIKGMLDLWRNQYGSMSVEDFINNVISDRQNTVPTWVKTIIEDQSIIGEAWNKRIFSDAGHPILAQRKTDDSHCLDPIFVYLRNWYNNSNHENIQYTFNDSKGTPAHTFIVEKDGKEYTAKWSATQGNYALDIDQSPFYIDCDAEKVIQYMKELIQQ